MFTPTKSTHYSDEVVDMTSFDDDFESKCIRIISDVTYSMPSHYQPVRG